MSENKHTPEPTGFDAEFLSKRLGRVCTRLGLTQPFGDNHEANAAVAGTTLAAVDLAIELLVNQRDEMRAVLSLPVAAHTRIGQGNAVSCAFSSPESSHKFKAALDAAISNAKGGAA